MARYQFNEERAPNGEWVERGTQLTQLVVRLLGFLLMVVGLWIGLAVIAEAWSLYREPQNIERFAKAIEQGSNLDKALSAVNRGEADVPGDATPAEILERSRRKHEDDVLGFRLSYFVAWIIVILLLMLVGRLAIAAVKAGGELVLYDMHIKRFARELVRENSKARS